MAKKLDWRIGAIAVIALAWLETFAMLKGIDGVLFSLIAIAIAGIAGYTIRK